MDRKLNKKRNTNLAWKEKQSVKIMLDIPVVNIALKLYISSKKHPAEYMLKQLMYYAYNDSNYIFDTWYFQVLEEISGPTILVAYSTYGPQEVNFCLKHLQSETFKS